MSAIEKFETGDVLPSHRARYWNEVCERRFSGTAVDLRSENFAGATWSWGIDELALLRPRTSTCKVVREDSGSTTERIILHLLCRGSGQFSQSGRSAELKPGDFVLFSTGHPYCIDFGEHETIVVECPREPLDERFCALDDKLVQRIDGTSPGVRMFHDFLLSLWHQGLLNNPHPDWEKEVGGLYYDMLAMALRGASYVGERERSSPQAERVRALVDAMLQEPELNSARLAQETNLSIRTIQTIFASLGTTPGAYILERRLTRAAERLRAQPDLPITVVAFDYGFNDSNYFSRCFRQRFGVRPREWRVTAR
jgi:AraC-like DNA-binding protein